MIDLVVIVQAVIAGLIMFRSSHEKSAWDRSGFALLACSAGLMTIRRVTMSFDRYAGLDRVLLPHMITWIMLASATCFILELIRRRGATARVVTMHRPRSPNDPITHSSIRFVWPFGLMLLLSATDFMPPRPWVGETVNSLTAEDALMEAVNGANPSVAMEVIRKCSARGIDTLRIIASGTGQEAREARAKLDTLHARSAIVDDHK